MATQTLDTKGLVCPQPILKIAAISPRLAIGDILVVTADCSTFPSDVRKWCEKTGKVLIVCNTDTNGVHTAQIRF